MVAVDEKTPSRLTNNPPPIEKKVESKTKKVVMLKRASYFGKGGVIKVDANKAQSLPFDVADDFVKRGIARLHDSEM